MLRIKLHRQEEHFFRFIAGSAVFSLLVFALTAAHLAYQSIFLLMGSAILVFALASRSLPILSVPLPDFPIVWKWILLGPFLVFTFYYFIHALAPEVSPDGSTYHLGIVGRYLQQHSFGKITTQLYANLSEAIELLFLVAYSIGKHSSAALVEFAFLLALPWGMLSYSRRIGFPKAGVFAALVVYISPVFGLSGTIAYNDAAGCAILFALFYLLQIWQQTRQRGLIPLIGLIAGFCYGAKYTLFLAVPFAGLFLLYRLWRDRQPFLRALVTYSAFAILMIAPWMMKNWFTVRNPFSPFANRLFPNAFVTIHFEQEYGDLMRNRDGLTLWQRPLDHVLLGGRTAGLLGPVFLLAPLALLALRFRPGRQLLLTACVFVLPAYSNVETRFLMPMAPFLSLALGMAIQDVPLGIPLVLAFHLLTAWPANIRTYADPNAWKLDPIYPAEAFRAIPEEVTLRKRLPAYAIAEMLERHTPADACIFSYGNPPEAYTSRKIIVKYESALGNLLGEILWTAFIPEYQPTQILTFAFSRGEFRRVRLVETASDPSEMWNISELRLMDENREVPRQRSWRLRASVNRWDVPLAFDNNPVTRWSTMEPKRSGMFVEVAFEQPTVLSAVVVESAPNQQSTRLKLEGERRPGEWALLADAPGIKSRDLSANLRAGAILELKARGITHLLIADDDFGKDDFGARARDWGIQFVETAAGVRLYKLL